MNIGKFLPPLLAASLLTACGGSSTTSGTESSTSILTDGSNTTLANAGNAYSGSRSLALLTAANTPDFVEVLFGTENISDNITARPEDSSASGNGGIVHAQRILSLLGKQHIRQQLYQARNVDLTDDCPGGGTASLKGTLSDTTNTGTLQVTYSQCRSENVVSNGSALLIIHSFDLPNLEPDAYTISMQGLGVQIDDVPYTLTGTLRSDANLSIGQTILTVNQYRRNLSTGQQALMEDFLINVDSNGYANMQGSLCEGTHGCVEATTVTPFLFDENGEALEGEAELNGASGSKAQLVINDDFMEVQLDENGDGIYDTTASSDSANLRNLEAGDDSLLVFNEIPNTAPQAVFELPASITAGNAVLLNGRQSTDAEGDELSYQWTLESAPEGSLANIDDAASVVTSFTPDIQGTYTFSLKVTDARQAETLTTASISVMSDATPLLHNVIDAEYSNTLNRLITVSSEPAYTLNIIHPQTGSQKTVALHFAPTSVGISPDGTTAVVGHNNAVTHVDLLAGSMIDFHTDIGFTVFDIALDENGIAYATPPEDMQWSYLYAIDLTTGAVREDTATDNTRLFGGAHLQFLPALDAVYTLDTAISPADLTRYDVSTAQPSRLYDSPYFGQYDTGEVHGKLWASEDGMYLLTAGGSLFQTANQEGPDMAYQRALADDDGLADSYLIQADHSQKAAKFAVISISNANSETPSYAVKTYTTPLLNLENSTSLNGLSIDGSSEPVIPQFVFFNTAGDTRYTILQQNGSSYLMAF